MRIVVNNKNKKSHEILGEYLYAKWKRKLPRSTNAKGPGPIRAKRKNEDVDCSGPDESAFPVRAIHRK